MDDWLKIYMKMFIILFGVILANVMIVGMCEPTQSRSENEKSEFSNFASSNILESQNSVYQLVNTSFSFDQALRYCSGHISDLTASGIEEDENRTKQLVSKSNLKRSIWFQSSNKQNPKACQALSKKQTIFPGLSFKSKDGFARVNVTFPSLSAVSVCVRIQWDPQNDNVATVFSYAAPVFNNEFQLRGQVKTKTSQDKSKRSNVAKKVRLALLIQGQHHPYKAELPLDKNWHHVCVTWDRIDGFWAIFVDGKEGDSGKGTANLRDIHKDGIFIVGQDQDSFGGTFTEPFVGNLTDLNIWDVSLELEQIQALHTCSQLVIHKAIFRWEDWELTVHPSVKNISAIMNCTESTQKPKEQNCTVFNANSNETCPYNLVSCTETYPFICRISKDRYQKMKETKESLMSNPSPFMKHLMQHGMTADDVFSDAVEGQSWTSVSHLLNVSEEAVQKEQKHLEGRDMISLMHILSRAANMPSTANRSCHDAKRLSQSFINLADSLISQDNTSTWYSIKEVVKGPMAVIQNIDLMVTNFNSLLINDTDHVQIHSKNIKLQVQQKSLSNGSGVSEFCGTDVGNRDCIFVQAKEMKQLHTNGFSNVTLLNTWYSPVKCFIETQNITLAPTRNSSLRHLETVLVSSIISSTVLKDGQPVSMPVNFTLQDMSDIHKNTTRQYIHVCAFWDFDLTSEGGGWSTEGCSFISSQNNFTSCYCNHTTNFAVLLQVYEVERSDEDEVVLQILGLIGSAISLCGLIITFILFVAVGVPKSDRTTVHKNLIVALALSQCLLICSGWAAGNKEACWLVTVLLHLFFLSSLCWMLVEGLLLWSKVVSVNISEERRMKLYYVLGWGLPVVIVAVTLSVTFDHYKAEKYCWLNIQSAAVWAFAGPVIFVVSVNAVVLFRVVMVTVASARRRAKMLTPSSDSKLHALDLTWAATRPVLILLPVLGVTWLCGVLVHVSTALVYLFVILNAFQGMYIFLVYAVYNSEVRNAIKRIQEKRKALSFTNCSQPISFMPSQKSPSASWIHSLPTQSSPDNSESSTPMTSSTASSLVFKNERFKEDNSVSFSLKPANGFQVVQLTAFKPSGC